MTNWTHIAVLLDRSGSMESIKDETISGYNQFVREQAGEPNASLTLVQFDTGGIDTLEEASPITKVKALNADTYQPRAMTPLLDALGKTITETGNYLRGIPEAKRPDKVVFVIITDGLENASRKFTRASIADMIKHQTDRYGWQFIYLGANQDAFAEARSLNINASLAANFVGAAVGSSFSSTSDNLRSYRITGQSRSLNYSDVQREKMSREKQ